MQLHDILWAVHDGKNHGRSEGEENIGEFSVTVGGRGPSDCSAVSGFYGARNLSYYLLITCVGFPLKRKG